MRMQGQGLQHLQIYWMVRDSRCWGSPSYRIAVWWLCSERGLGLSEEHEGILLLPDDAPVGKPLRDYLGDVVLDIDLTPNLARALSILGVAREVAAITGAPLRIPEVHL